LQNAGSIAASGSFTISVELLRFIDDVGTTQLDSGQTQALTGGRLRC
jgi:hypothetical protein